MRRRLESQYKIDIKRFKKGKRISKGGFGIVYQVTNVETNKLYAAKVIDCGDDESQCSKMIGREVEIMMSVNHPTIIKLIGYSTVDFQAENNVCLIMELATNGSLFDVIKNIQMSNGPHDYTNTSRQIILIGVSRAMKYLHDRNIIHRDLKIGNILLNENFYPLVTDFGMSKFYEIGHTVSQSQHGGTLPYMAPEIHRGDPYGPKADVYAFAIIMYEILTDSLAFPEVYKGEITDFNFRKKIVNEGYRPKFTVPIKTPLKKLIQQCWSDNPDERPNFGEIFKYLTNRSDNRENFFLDDIDVDEVKLYIDDITEINDPIEKLLAKNEIYEKQIKIQNRIHSKELELFKLETIQNPDKKTKRTIPKHLMFVLDFTKSSKNFLQAIHDKAEDIAIDLQISERRSIFNFGSILYYNDTKKPLYFDFNDEVENFSKFLENAPPIQGESSGNSPSDFITPLIMATSKLSSVFTKEKIIVWIASSPAQGKKFCGFDDGHQKEEEELEFLVKKLAHDNYHFYGIYTNEKAKKTFDEMRSIFNSCGKSQFKCYSIDSDINFDFELTRKPLPILDDI